MSVAKVPTTLNWKLVALEEGNYEGGARNQGQWITNTFAGQAGLLN